MAAIAGPEGHHETFLGNIPLKYQRCGNANPTIGVRHNGNTDGYVKPVLR
jgi:hypothetical protein